MRRSWLSEASCGCAGIDHLQLSNGLRFASPFRRLLCKWLRVMSIGTKKSAMLGYERSLTPGTKKALIFVSLDMPRAKPKVVRASLANSPPGIQG
jgi:hypothetical protein